jgi:hypothetical protein
MERAVRRRAVRERAVRENLQREVAVSGVRVNQANYVCFRTPCFPRPINLNTQYIVLLIMRSP